MNSTSSYTTVDNITSDQHTTTQFLILLHNGSYYNNQDATSTPELFTTAGNGGELTSKVDNTVDVISGTTHPDKEVKSGSILWNIFQSGEVDLGIIAASLGILLSCIAGILLLSYVWQRRRRYTKLFSSSSAEDVGFIYNPATNIPHLDEEYENTFVGVSIPLLQDVSKV